MKQYIIYLSVIVLSFSGIDAISQNQTSTIYIVRHAEKVLDGSKDPMLTKIGFARANKLAEILDEVALTAIYSSPYKRTRQTAQLVATNKNLEILPYNPSMQKEFVSSVLEKHRGGNLLIVGHSNTVPGLLNIFTGTEKYQQLADDEYDKLFIVNIDADGLVKVKVEVY